MTTTDTFKRLQKLIGPQTDEESWLSVYLGSDLQLPRICTTRAYNPEHRDWHYQNGLVVNKGFGTHAMGGQYLELSKAAKDGFEIVREHTYPFVCSRTGLKAAVMYETYDPDAFTGGIGVAEHSGALAKAVKIATFLGLREDESDCDVILPEENLSNRDFEAAGLVVSAQFNDEFLRRLNRNPADIHNLSPRDFETLIARLLLDLGYQIWLTPEQKDGGKDILGILKSDAATTLTLVECKKYRSSRPVSVEIVRGVYGVLQQQRATNALIATTSRFTKAAVQFRDSVRYQLSLKDADDIADWLSKYK